MVCVDLGVLHLFVCAATRTIPPRSLQRPSAPKLAIPMASVLLTPRQLAPTVGPAVALAGFHPDGTFFINSGELLALGSIVRLSGRLHQPHHRQCRCGVFAVSCEARRLGVAIASARSHLLHRHQRLQRAPGDCGLCAVSPARPGGSSSALSPLSGPGLTLSECIWRTQHTCAQAARRRSSCVRVPRTFGCRYSCYLGKSELLKRKSLCRLKINCRGQAKEGPTWACRPGKMTRPD